MGGYAVWWIERYMRLFQGRWAGEPAVMHGCKTCGKCWTIPREFDPDHAIERARDHAACVAAGHDMDWQYDFVMRLFGWQRYSPDLMKPVRRFTRGDLWIPKKSKKSPTLAFIGWYLLVGDGVKGQNIYFGAKDGQQAREMVGSSVVASWEESPELRSCVQHKINEMSFTHIPTKSRMKPLSSSSERTTKSKEGINGSVLIDEVHVVDAMFMARIKRAGISRDEPLILGASTAGLDTTAYGKQRQDYGRRVASGEIADDDYLFVCYEAPQDTVLEELTEDQAVALGRAANPAWGNTVLEREFRSDFRESKGSTIDELYDFGTYRLNIWQNSSSPWLREGQWQGCGDELELSMLEGRRCSLGLDLSRTKDMTAAVFVFDKDSNGRRPIWPMFWIPENTAKRLQREIADYKTWEAEGFVTLCEGDTISHAQVLAGILSVSSHFFCENVYYDPTFADWITEQLSDCHGIPRVEFKQSMNAYAAPCDAFESEVLSGTLLHPRHPILDWQAGHAHVYRNKFTKHKRPVKPDDDHNSLRTIDGIAATVMGYARAVESDVTIEINQDMVML